MKSSPVLPPMQAPTVLSLMGERAHRVLGMVLALLLIALPLIYVSTFFDTDKRTADRNVVVVMFAGLLGLGWLYRKARDALVLGGLVVVMLAAGAAFTIGFGSVRGVGLLALVGAIACCGVFLGRRALTATLLASVAIVGGLIVVQNLGWLRTPVYDVGLTQWVQYSLALTVIALSVGLARSLAIDGMQRALESEAWIASVLRNSPSALAVSGLDDNRLREVNVAFERMFGWQRTQVVGQTGLEAELWMDRGVRERYLDAVRREGRVLEYTATLRRADGEPFAARVSGERVDIGGQSWLVSSIVDVDAEVRTQAALQESEARFRRLFHDSPVAATIFTPREMHFLDCNAAYEALLGRSREQVVGHLCKDLGIWDEVCDLAGDFDRLERDGTIHNRPAQLRHADGSRLHVLFSWTLIDVGGQRCVLSQVVDVSEQRRAEQALRELNEVLEQRVHERTQALEASNAALAQARDAAEAATRAKSQFLANMSHEIRTPLNGVIGVAQALANTELNPIQKEMLGLIQSSGQTLQVLLSDILDLARVESGRLELADEPFDLGRAVREAARLYETSARDKGIQFFVEIDPAVDRWIAGDVVRLKQILTNLVSNAVKFTSEGFVCLTVAPGPALRGGETLRFSVEDTGIGFDSETRDRLFSRFEQADGAITRKFGGSGLGLAISRQLAEMMDGRLDCESEPGGGSAFMLTIPLRAAEAPATTSARAAGPAALDRAVRVLLADDHPVNRKVVEMILAQAEVELTSVEDGAAALEAVRGGDYDLVLMDMQMPIMDGLTATREIRLHEATMGLPRTPVVMLTANALAEHIAAAEAAGADRHLAKPFDAAELLELVLTLPGALDASMAA